MDSFGRLLLFTGLALAVIGGVLSIGDRFGLGRLPGDLSWRTGSMHVHVPLATSLLLSVVATVLLNLFLRR